jgi:hypothetical protein
LRPQINQGWNKFVTGRKIFLFSLASRKGFPSHATIATSRSLFDAGWSSPVARQAHNLKVVSSNLAPATNNKARYLSKIAGFTFKGVERRKLFDPSYMALADQK